MAAVTFRDHLPSTAPAIDLDRIGLAFGNAVLNLIDAFNAERRKLQTRRALSHLTDAQLADIGVIRADIAEITK